MTEKIEKDIEAAVRKVMIDEAAARSIKAVLETQEGRALIDQIAQIKAAEAVEELVKKYKINLSDTPTEGSTDQS